MVKDGLCRITWTRVRAQGFLSTTHGSKLCNFCQELHLYVYFSSLLQRPEIKSSATSKIPNGTRRWENKISFSNNLKKVLMPFGELTDLPECELQVKIMYTAFINFTLNIMVSSFLLLIELDYLFFFQLVMIRDNILS